MTKDQINLLLDLKASKERGSASMSCGTRNNIAEQLHKLGLIVRHGTIASSIFYHINDRGLKSLKGIHRK